ncbi:MAG: 16S rRNA (guanine(527)-N(7))-methyltransferase RsmG [Polyangiales bacterium]
MTQGPRPSIPLPAPEPLAPPEDLSARAAALGVTLDAAMAAKLGDYLARLLAMNERMNLTAITDPTEAWSRHALDALTLSAEVPQGSTVVDVGSGGGVPAIPLAIARPDLRVTMVEATQKKAAFLAEVSAALGLRGVTVRPERAEAVKKGPLRSSFDVATARAVGKVALLVPLMAPLVKRGGRLVLIKGQRADEELAEAKLAMFDHGVVHERTVPTPTGRVVVLRREGRA